jgi:hypothetical protein
MTGNYTLTWNSDAFRKQTISNLAANAELVGQFCEADARVRLNRITEPEWGGKYRRGLVSSLLAHEIVVGTNEVTINIGIKSLAGNPHIGFYIEMGSSRFGPHPFLRPSVLENASKITALLSGS